MLQALAVSAAPAGSVIDGVPVVAVGGRSLSLAAGLLSESTVWAILRRLRETPGAPILLIAKGSGLVADRYALTTPDITDPTPDDPGRPAVTDVHPAWRSSATSTVSWPPGTTVSETASVFSAVCAVAGK